MSGQPLVSIVVPHYNGKEILYNCLKALEKTAYSNKEVIVVNNASVDKSVMTLENDFPWLTLINNQENMGYAGGCNVGFDAAHGELILFLNNDTEFGPDWLQPLVDCCLSNDKIAACQPKILALKTPEKFDYSGAAGGLIDILGYPFARGRLFFTTEKDKRQYDKPCDIFWASGTAFLVKKPVLLQVGKFDEAFFAHMEEIDLNWRLHLAGYRVLVAPESVVYHNSGSTLKPDSYIKIFLNHRNNLAMMIKNYQLSSLLWLLPARLLLEFIALVFAVIRLDLVRMRAVVAAFFYVLTHLSAVIKKRTEVQKIRCVTDKIIFTKMYRGSIVFDYFVKGVRAVRELKL